MNSLVSRNVFEHKENPVDLALKVADVSKKYGTTVALDCLSLAVRQGQFFGLLGPNGAGKTTLIGAIVGLVRFSGGSIQVLGHDVRIAPLAARRPLGLAPQEINLDRFFSIRQILCFQGGYYGLARAARESLADELLERFALSEKAETQYYRLSGGMQRRLLIARAMMSRPKILILDEPTAGVDVEQRRGLWQYLRGLNRDGTTIILTTHYIDEAEALCDTVAIIDRGRICEQGSPAELITKYCEVKVRIALSRALTPAEQALFPPEVEWEGAALRARAARPALITQKLLHTVTTLSDVVVCDIHVDRGSLEEVFLKTTGSRFADEA